MPTSAEALSAEADCLSRSVINEVRGLNSDTRQIDRVVAGHFCLKAQEPNNIWSATHHTQPPTFLLDPIYGHYGSMMIKP